jgi:tripartite-type tricarboxylate transporter receptor subunit TctC
MQSIERQAFCGLTLLVACGLAAAPAKAEDFYKDKTITINVSGSGTYDRYARLVGEYLTKYIPGHPTVVVKQMSGASGLKATNYIYNNAPKDGTELAGTHGHIPTIPFFRKQGVHYDPTKLGWIGSATKEVYIAYVWHTSPVQSMEDARVKTIDVGGQALGSMSVDAAVLANATMGTKFKIITGYAGSAETALAVERGEINGHMGTTYTNLLSSHPDWIKDKKAKIIAQFGTKKYKAMPDVPLLTDYILKPDDKKAVQLFLARQETGKPYFAPPGIPPERLKILRDAFDKAVHDPQLIEEAHKANLDIDDPMTGDDIEKFIAEVFSSPPSYAKRINDIFAKFGKAKS